MGWTGDIHICLSVVFFFFQEAFKLRFSTLVRTSWGGKHRPSGQAAGGSPTYVHVLCHCGEITLSFPVVHFPLLERRDDSGFSPTVSLGRLKTSGKESARSAGDLGSIPGLGRSSRDGNGYPLQYSGRENSMDCIVYALNHLFTILNSRKPETGSFWSI